MALDAASEEFIALVDSLAQEVAAGKGYDTNANHQRLKANGQRSSIQCKFAEQKKYHDLGKVRYWGLAKVTIQTLLTCLVVNCRKIVKLLSAGLCPTGGKLCPAAG